MDYTRHFDSPLGGITLASDGDCLIGLWFDGQAHFGATLSPAHEERPLPVFDQAARWLDIYFSGGVPDFTPPLRLRGSAFRRTVWALLMEIPYGRTVAYGALAAAAARLDRSTMSARAVGGAVARNPVSLIIPCHRVVGADGSLTGYAGGTDKKLRLLKLERVDMSGLRVPRGGTAL